MPDWLLWVLLAIALAAGEIFTPGLFFLGPIALAAVAAAIVAAARRGMARARADRLRASGSVASLARPASDRAPHIRDAAAIRTGTAALVGSRARRARARSTRDGGRVKIGGEVWSARAFDEHAR